jgi:hypothetical protein
MNNSKVIDLTIFVVEAMATNLKCHKTIDRIYQDVKLVAHKLATNSNLYNHPIITNGHIEHEVYAKRALGIILMEKDDYLYEIIESGWSSLLKYINRKKTIDLKKVVDTLLGDINKVSDDHLNGLITITMLLAKSNNIPIGPNEDVDTFQEMIYTRFNHYKNAESELIENRITYELLNNSNSSVKAKQILERVESANRELSNLDMLFQLDKSPSEEVRNTITSNSFMFDLEDLMLSSMVKSIDITKDDKLAILSLYWDLYHNQNIEKATQFLVSNLIILFTCRAYKSVKRQYFENNSETMFYEIEVLESTIERISKDLSAEKKATEELNKQVNYLRDTYKKNLEKEIISLNKKLKNEKKESEKLQKKLETSENKIKILEDSINNISIPEEPILSKLDTEGKIIDINSSDKKIMLLGGITKFITS